MSKSYEFQGKNVDQAIEKASDELSIPPEKIKHEVLAYGSSGIFGLVGVKKAKIKVFVDEDKNKESGLNRLTRSRLQTGSKNRPLKKKHLNPQRRQKYEEELVASGIQALQTIIDGITVGASVNVAQKRDKVGFFNFRWRQWRSDWQKRPDA